MIGNLADQELGMRLLHLDIWGDVCLRGYSDEQVLEKLNPHVRVLSE